VCVDEAHTPFLLTKDNMSYMKQIDALLTERNSYAKRNLQSRVDAVNKELVALGWVETETATALPEVEQATAARAVKRTTKKDI
jgi:hypothetical protein